MGFMGVGKGTLARVLSSKSGLYAIDTDDLIESLTNKKIKKIFEKFGETYFRNLEQRTADWVAQSVEHSIISVGGGFYKVNNLEALGTVVYLKADFDWIYNRIVNSPNAQKKLKKRPLFNAYDEAKKLYDSRVYEYESRANIVLDVTQDFELVVEEALKIIESIQKAEEA